MKIKRFLALLCAVMTLFAVLGTAGAEGPAISKVDKSLYTRIDPATGKAYDLKGQKVYIYNYWGEGDWHSGTPVTDEEIARYNYDKWIEKTYNCKVIIQTRGDWNSIPSELRKFVQNKESKLALFIIPGGKDITELISDDLLADWKKSSAISLSDAKWNRATVSMMSYAGGVYGVSPGKSEPRQCLFFNKRVLDAFGIDWNELYTMQKNGTWTWDAFEKLLKNVKDGIESIYPLTGYADDLYRIAVFSNGGSFFDYKGSGKLAVTADSAKSKEALTWAKGIWSKYSAPRPENADWDWYKQFWKEGKTAFYVGQVYNMMEMSDMADEYGFVAFPKGPNGKGYVTIVSNNLTVIPNIYSNSDISKLSMIYDLWTCNPPDWDDEETLPYGIEEGSDSYETYLLLTGADAGKADRTELLGTVNAILGESLLWPIQSSDLDELIASAKKGWKAYLAKFNEVIERLQKEADKNTLEAGGLVYTLNKADLTAKVTGAKKNSITAVSVPNTVKAGKKTYKVTEIAENAFKGFKKLKTAKIGKYVRIIGKAAFKDCVKLTSVTGAAGLVVIGDGVFSGCTALPSITLNAKVASIGDDAFLKCKSLKSLVIKTKKLNADVIGKNAFKGIQKKAAIKCPSKKLAASYKKLFTGAGAPKTAKYTY